MNEIERKQRYRQHRLRIQNATSLVDSQMPKVRNAHRENREPTFIEMMMALYRNGNCRTFTQSPVRQAKSDILCHEIPMKATTNVLAANVKLTSNEDKHDKRCRAYSQDKHFEKFFNSIPPHVWQRYWSLPIIKSPNMLVRLLRPRIFLDLIVGTGQPLGRLTVQLLTEACPEIVTQFVCTCWSHQGENFKFTRLQTHVWLEGELHLRDKNAVTHPNNLEHDPMALNHGTAGGILSFPSRYLRGSKFRFISFAISFQPIDVLNGKRIAFGKIRHGQHVLEQLQNFKLAHNGKPVNEVIVVSCGVL